MLVPTNIQQLTAPDSNTSFLSVSLSPSNLPLKAWHQNTSNKLITTGQPTPHLPPRQTYGIHSPDCNEHSTLPIQPRISPVPCDQEWEGASVAAKESHVTSRPNTQGSCLTGSSPTSSEARQTGWGVTLFVIMPWASRTAQSAVAALCWIPFEEWTLPNQRIFAILVDLCLCRGDGLGEGKRLCFTSFAFTIVRVITAATINSNTQWCYVTLHKIFLAVDRNKSSKRQHFHMMEPIWKFLSPIIFSCISS